MKQTQFETRQRAEQLLREAVALWQRSAFSEQLENLENDPVFTMLMTALAYQTNDIEGELERLKQEVVEDFADSLVPYELLHARPATAVITASLPAQIPQIEVGAANRFQLKSTEFEFIPLFRTQLIRTQIKSFQRLDGRRWKVSLAFDAPVSNLSGFSFAVRNTDFRELKLTVNGKQLPLIAPSDYAQLPVDTAFGMKTMLYNNLHAHIAETACLDMFAQQNIQMFFIPSHPNNTYYPTDLEQLDLVFEFLGISESFSFSKEQLMLNTLMLVNARIQTATLSPATPIVRVAGADTAQLEKPQFMHLVCPAEDQLYGDSAIEVRHVSADRFNRGSLLRLLAALNAKYHTDFQAFRKIASETNDDLVQQLQQLLERMEQAVRNTGDAVSAVYLILRSQIEKQGSVDIQYLTTLGASVNYALNNNSTFSGVNELSGIECSPVVPPVPGSDERNDFVSGMEMARYLVATGDRIVTPADIRMFCYQQLQTRYDITPQMVQSIVVSHRNQLYQGGCGYEIIVEIQLLANAFVKRTLENKITGVENTLRKMMEVRSTNIYPISVTITLAEQKE